jgi:hypothetical protein
VASILDLLFSDVRTRKINDPSLTWPGDVGAFADNVQMLGAEVKQRPLTEEDALLFARQLREAKVDRGIVVALAQTDDPLIAETLTFHARRLSDVEVWLFTKASTLLRDAVLYSDKSLLFSLSAFPRHALRRMEQLEVSVERMKEWAALFAASELVAL